jgi:hypothetical protein
MSICKLLLSTHERFLCLHLTHGGFPSSIWHLIYIASEGQGRYSLIPAMVESGSDTKKKKNLKKIKKERKKEGKKERLSITSEQSDVRMGQEVPYLLLTACCTGLHLPRYLHRCQGRVPLRLLLWMRLLLLVEWRHITTWCGNGLEGGRVTGAPRGFPSLGVGQASSRRGRPRRQIIAAAPALDRL